MWPPKFLINDFAIRCFRDTADRDYIHARLAYRADLIPQFLWSSLHCLEKYAKCILLLNRVRAIGLRHVVSESLERMALHGPFQIPLSANTKAFLKHLEENGAEYRYFEVSYWNTGHDIVKLDRAVWELRRYCQVLNHDVEVKGRTVSALQSNLERIKEAVTRNEKGTCVTGGWLEQVAKNKLHAAREPFLWNNLFFGPSRRRKIRIKSGFEAGNSPLHLNPEIIDDVAQYVHIPKDILKLWRTEAAKRKEEKQP